MEHDVILEKLEGVKNEIVLRHQEQEGILKSLHRKVDKTNGRVTQLEKWRAYLAGAIAILTTLIVPMLFLILSKLISDL